MRKILVALALAASLAGCASFPVVETTLQLGTASVANPITRDRELQMEQAVRIVFAGLNAWKSACRSGAIASTCRAQIASVQVYTRQLPPYLAQLRNFTDRNDQINAAVVFNTLTSLIGTVKAQAAASGQPIGS